MLIDLERYACRLQTGTPLRIVGGRGCVATCVEGMLWITEEHCAEDICLVAGESYRIRNQTLALIEAVSDAQLLLRVGQSGHRRRIDRLIQGFCRLWPGCLNRTAKVAWGAGFPA